MHFKNLTLCLLSYISVSYHPMATSGPEPMSSFAARRGFSSLCSLLITIKRISDFASHMYFNAPILWLFELTFISPVYYCKVQFIWFIIVNPMNLSIQICISQFLAFVFLYSHAQQIVI